MVVHDSKTHVFYLPQKAKKFVNYDIDDNVCTADISMAERFIDEDCALLIHQFLHSMDEPYKEVFSLRVFGELPFEKIGLLFGKSSGWARITFYLAKEKISEYMEAIDYERSKL